MVVYKNVSTNQLRLYVASPGLPYMFSSRVFDEANKELPMTGQALDQIEDGHSSLSGFRSVSPGARLAFSLELDHFYQFKKTGICQVHVTAHGPLVDASPPLSTGMPKSKLSRQTLRQEPLFPISAPGSSQRRQPGGARQPAKTDCCRRGLFPAAVFVFLAAAARAGVVAADFRAGADRFGFFRHRGRGFADDVTGPGLRAA